MFFECEGVWIDTLQNNDGFESSWSTVQASEVTHMLQTIRMIFLANAVLLVLSGCRASEPLREYSAREARLVALDSLARPHPCTAIHATVLVDPARWTRRHACAVAGRALEMLGARPAHEPYLAPADTAHVTVIRIVRQHWCMFSSDPGVSPPGRMDSLRYVVEMDVPGRPHFLNAAMNAWTFEGGASFDAHP